MNGKSMMAIRERVGGLTQAEMARALEVSPVTLNRWENDDPRYKPPVAGIRLLEALDELARGLDPARKQELVDLLRVTTVAGVIARAAIDQILPIATINRLAATPGLGWLGMVAGVGMGAALPFFSHPPKPPKSESEPRQQPRPSKSKAQSVQAAEAQSLYTLGVDSL